MDDAATATIANGIPSPAGWNPPPVPPPTQYGLQMKMNKDVHG